MRKRKDGTEMELRKVEGRGWNTLQLIHEFFLSYWFTVLLLNILYIHIYFGPAVIYHICTAKGLQWTESYKSLGFVVSLTCCARARALRASFFAVCIIYILYMLYYVHCTYIHIYLYIIHVSCIFYILSYFSMDGSYSQYLSI